MTTLARSILDTAPQIRGIHPLADLFPLLTEEELSELADDIRAHGLRQPLIITPDGILLDGRNRLVACHLAGVEPTVQVYEGDPAALIASLNLYRRNLTQGQRALLRLRTTDRNNLLEFGRRAVLAKELGVRSNTLSDAALILQYAEEYVDELIAGRGQETFSSVLEIARIRRDEAKSDAERAEAAERQRLADLKARDARLELVALHQPDLAQMVRDGALALEGAEAAWREQQRADVEARELGTRNLSRALDVLFFGPDTDIAEAAAYTASRLNVQSPVTRGRLTVENLRRSAQYLSVIAEILDQQERRTG